MRKSFFKFFNFILFYLFFIFLNYFAEGKECMNKERSQGGERETLKPSMQLDAGLDPVTLGS